MPCPSAAYIAIYSDLIHTYIIRRTPPTRLTETVDLELRGASIRTFALNPAASMTRLADGIWTLATTSLVWPAGPEPGSVHVVCKRLTPMKGLLIYFEVIAGKQPQFEAAVGALIAQVRAHDPSFELYSLAKLRDSATCYVMVERFQSEEAQQAHRNYPYVIDAMPAIDVCLAGTPVVEWLDYVS